METVGSMGSSTNGSELGSGGLTSAPCAVKMVPLYSEVGGGGVGGGGEWAHMWLRVYRRMCVCLLVPACACVFGIERGEWWHFLNTLHCQDDGERGKRGELLVGVRLCTQTYPLPACRPAGRQAKCTKNINAHAHTHRGASWTVSSS